MSEWLKRVVRLLEKEMKVELRGKELLTLLACNSLLMSVVVGAGVSSAMIDQGTTAKMFPPLLWLVFLFTTTASVNRGNEHELDGRGYEGLLLSGYTAEQMFVSRLLVTWFYLAAAHAMTVATLAVTLNQDILALSPALIGVGAFTALGVSALMVILSVVASTSRLKGVLLPLISLPLLFPIFFAGTEATAEIVSRGVFDPSSVWCSLIACADVVFVAAGINLYGFAIKE